MPGIGRPGERGAIRCRPLGCRQVLLGPCALVVVAAAGCSSTGSGATSTAVPSVSSSATSTPTPSITPTIDPADAPIIAAYEASNDAFIHASSIPDPRDPTLPKTMTGNELAQVIARLAQDQEQGLVGRGPITPLHPHVVAVAAGEATVQDCRYDASLKYSASTGQLVPPNQSAAYETAVARLVLSPDGAWKVSDLQLQEFVQAQGCPAGF